MKELVKYWYIYTINLLFTHYICVVDVIENLNLKKYFDFIIASSLVGYEKPNKKIYEHALTMAGGIKSEDALHVGDDVEKYVKGIISGNHGN
jgi:HAD superfamily hydrolase (TIGR01549 family)